MTARLRILVGPLLALFFLCGAVVAQIAAVSRFNAIPNLSRLTRSAGYIFAGTVMSVEHAASVEGNTVASVRIRFRVDEAVRGVKAGQILSIREWAGLWDGGERYRPGQRVMLFLYPTSRLGLTSSVAGSQGRFNLDQNGQIELPPATPHTPARIARIPIRPSPAPTMNTKDLLRAIRGLGRP